MEHGCNRIDALSALARRLGFALRKAKGDLRTSARPNDSIRFLEILSDLVADLGDELRARPLALAPMTIQAPAQLLRDLAVRSVPQAARSESPQLAAGSMGGEMNVGKDTNATAKGAGTVSEPKAVGSASTGGKELLPPTTGQDTKHKSLNHVSEVSGGTCAEPELCGSPYSMPPSPPPSCSELLESLQRASRWLSRPIPTMASAFSGGSQWQPPSFPSATTAGICWCGCYVWPVPGKASAHAATAVSGDIGVAPEPPFLTHDIVDRIFDDPCFDPVDEPSPSVPVSAERCCMDTHIDESALPPARAVEVGVPDLAEREATRQGLPQIPLSAEAQQICQHQ